MKTAIQPLNASDAELLARCRGGDRDAYGHLVERHQSLVCALAYNVCGDLARSEDVAQDAFVTAWKRLAELRDPTRFKAWLCEIAHNLARAVTRRQTRRPELPLDETRELVSEAPTPDEAAVSREEEAMMWDALEAVSDVYREPLILYYRERQSVSEVAQALDLSEDAVRQRLARGRAALKAQVMALVENTLARTRPGRPFTLAVLAALPVFLPANAAAATIVASTAAKGAGAKIGAASLGIFFGVILGPLLGLVGGWLGVRAAAESATYERERQFVLRRLRRATLLCVLIIVASVAAAFLARGWIVTHPAPTAIIAAGWALALGLWLLIEIMLALAQQRRIYDEEAAAGAPIRAPVSRWQWLEGWRFRSSVKLLGLPLLDVAFGHRENGRYVRGRAVGWVAIGDHAFGVLFATGGSAVGGIAVGGISCGLFAFGGLGAGLLTFAGFGLGFWTFSGFALGWKAFGGVVMGMFASGGLALGGKVAFGGGAFTLPGGHANDAVAESTIAADRFFQIAYWLSLHPYVLVLITFILSFLPWIAIWFVQKSRLGSMRTPVSRS